MDSRLSVADIESREQEKQFSEQQLALYQKLTAAANIHTKRRETVSNMMHHIFFVVTQTKLTECAEALREKLDEVEETVQLQSTNVQHARAVLAKMRQEEENLFNKYLEAEHQTKSDLDSAVTIAQAYGGG